VMALDRPHTLVMLETRLIEVSVDKMNQYGLKYDQLSFATPGGVGTSFVAPPVDAKNAFNFSGMMRGSIDLNVIIDLMVRNGDGRMLMDSKLTTTNNREASLHIGEIIPYAIQSYNMSSSGGLNQQIEKEEVGVMLKMTPHINDDNQITLTLSPEVSSIVGWSVGDIPRIRTRKTTTTVRVENGQTVILAGLLHEERTQTIHKLPILGDIPVLGLLFQNKRDEVKKTNLIIEVVPRIINDPAEIARYMTIPGAASRPGRGPRGEGGRGEGRGHRGERAERHQHRPASVSVVEPAPAVHQEPAVIEFIGSEYVETEHVPAPAPVNNASAAPAPALPAAQPSVEPAHSAPIPEPAAAPAPAGN